LKGKSFASIDGTIGKMAGSAGELRDRGTMPHSVAFLIDVDATLLDNGRIRQDLKDHPERRAGRRRTTAALLVSSEGVMR
jgi:hypothetical protein